MWIRARFADDVPFRLPYPHLKWTKWVEVPDDYDKELHIEMAKEIMPCSDHRPHERMHFAEMEERKDRPPGV